MSIQIPIDMNLISCPLILSTASTRPPLVLPSKILLKNRPGSRAYSLMTAALHPSIPLNDIFSNKQHQNNKVSHALNREFPSG